VGLTLLSPDSADFDLELLFAGTLGGGLKVPISGPVGLRLEGRGVAMPATGSAAGACGGGLLAAGSTDGPLDLNSDGAPRVVSSAGARTTGSVTLTADFDGDGRPEGGVRCNHHGDIVGARYRLQP